MRAHVGDRGHTLALSKNESANRAGRDQFALALIEIGKRTDVRPPAVPGKHGARCRAQCRAAGGLERASDDSACQRAGGDAKSRDQCGAACQPCLLGGGLEDLSEPGPLAAPPAPGPRAARPSTAPVACSRKHPAPTARSRTGSLESRLRARPGADGEKLSAPPVA